MFHVKGDPISLKNQDDSRSMSMIETYIFMDVPLNSLVAGYGVFIGFAPEKGVFGSRRELF
jgi:hypothetical protein